MCVQLGTVKTDRFSMDYCRFGQGEKVLVIIPGISVQSIMPSAEVIAKQYELLSGEYTVYVFDRRKKVPEGYSIPDMASDTARAIRELGFEKVDIFGASQGGMIAMEIAADHPGLVNKLVLASTAARVEGSAAEIFDGWIGLAKEGREKDLYLDFGKAVYTAEVFKQAKGLLTEAALTVTGEELAQFVIIAESLKGFDMTERLEKIACPALVVGSGDDAVLGSEASKHVAAGIKGSELYMYDGFGHAVYDTAPDFVERMKAFLD